MSGDIEYQVGKEWIQTFFPRILLFRGAKREFGVLRRCCVFEGWE
jgi:hypothetical protein